MVAEFTVKGAVYYFGRIYNMDDELIDERYQELRKLLELPPDDRYRINKINNLKNNIGVF